MEVSTLETRVNKPDIGGKALFNMDFGGNILKLGPYETAFDQSNFLGKTQQKYVLGVDYVPNRQRNPHNIPHLGAPYLGMDGLVNPTNP